MQRNGFPYKTKTITNMHTKIYFLFVTIFLMSFYQEIAGVCCPVRNVLQRKCDDGYRPHLFQNCGVGKCNIFGCHCKGGCRKAAWFFEKD